MVRNKASVGLASITTISRLDGGACNSPTSCIYRGSKPYFNKTVLIPDRPVNSKMLRSKYVMAGSSFAKLGRPKDKLLKWQISRTAGYI